MYTRKLAAIGAAALLIGLAASAPAQADLKFNGLKLNGFTMNGFTMNGFTMNGFTMNGFTMNGFTMNGLYLNGPDQPVGFNFNALELHAVVLPTDAQ
jgi:hypothetical protein